jgi:hypothetical protein
VARKSRQQIAEAATEAIHENYLREVRFLAAQIALVPRRTTREALREAWERAGGHYLVTDGRVDRDALYEDVPDALEGGAA